MKALILIDSYRDLGMADMGNGDEFLTRIRLYSNDSDAYMAFAETPCTWSEIVDYSTKEQVAAKAEEIIQNLKSGKYNDYI